MSISRSEVRLREMFSSEYKLITALPAWSSWEYSSAIGQELDDILFARYKDILIDSERYLTTLNSWLLSHLTDLSKIYEVITAEYDPLSNYDMTESEKEIRKEGEKLSEAQRFGTERTTQTIPDTKASRYTTTYDSAAANRLDSYTEQEVTDAPQLEGHNAQVTVTEQLPDSDNKRGTLLTEHYSGNVIIDSLTGDTGYKRELTRSGNIGVMTSTQMAESETSYRIKYSFINVFCDMFAREMTIGVWDL